MGKAFLLPVLLFLSIFFCSPAYAATVVINEFMSHPSSGSDWIELYNTTEQSIVLDNWKLVDSTSTMNTLSGSIDSNGFKVVEVSNRLNNGGDTIILKDQTEAIIDTYSYTSDPGIDISIGRSSNGTGDFTVLTTATKGSSNSPASPTATLTPSPTNTPSSTPTPTKTPTPTPTSKPTATPKSVAAATSTPTPLPTIKTFFSPSPTPEPEVENNAPTSILGEMVTASPSASPTIAETKRASFFDLPKLFIGAGFVFLAGSVY